MPILLQIQKGNITRETVQVVIAEFVQEILRGPVMRREKVTRTRQNPNLHVNLAITDDGLFVRV